MKKIALVVSMIGIGISLLLRGSFYVLDFLIIGGRILLVVSLYWLLHRFGSESQRDFYKETLQVPLMRVSSVGLLRAVMIDDWFSVLFRCVTRVLVRNKHYLHGEKSVLFMMSAVVFAYLMHYMSIGIDSLSLFAALSAGLLVGVNGYYFTGTPVKEMILRIPFLLLVIIRVVTGIVRMAKNFQG